MLAVGYLFQLSFVDTIDRYNYFLHINVNFLHLFVIFMWTDIQIMAYIHVFPIVKVKILIQAVVFVYSPGEI
jgi:hypothetical protein